MTTTKGRSKSSSGEKTISRKRTTKKRSASVPADERRGQIERAAYFKAENRGFQDGCPESDWLSAEREIDEVWLRDKAG